MQVSDGMICSELKTNPQRNLILATLFFFMNEIYDLSFGVFCRTEVFILYSLLNISIMSSL